MDARQKVYLRPNTAIEPLWNRWYAWALLIPPATGSMFLKHRQIPIMESYLSAPELHWNAIQDPQLRGGQFVNYPPSRSGEVKELLEWTHRARAKNIELANAIRELDKLLAAETGFSLEPVYAKVPGPLKGYVELVYDLRNNATARYIEEALYRSPYFDLSAQSIAMLAVSNTDTERRPFAFYSPRLPDSENFHLPVSFAKHTIDTMYRARWSPAPFGEIAEAVGVPEKDIARFATFFSEADGERERTAAPFDGDGVRIRYFGHACVLVETKTAKILFDPLISYDDGKPGKRYVHADLPKDLDCVVITHAHNDHVVFEALLELRHRTRYVVVPRSTACTLEDPSLRSTFRHLGFPRVVELGELESFLDVEGIELTALPFFGEHGDLQIRTKLAYLVKARGRRIMMMVDSNNIEPMLYEHLKEFVGQVDVLFIGLECDGVATSADYGPVFAKPLLRKMDQGRRLNGSDAAKASDIVDRWRPGQVFVYAMAAEPWLGHILNVNYTDQSVPIIEAKKFVAYCRSIGIPAERLYGQHEHLLEAGKE